MIKITVGRAALLRWTFSKKSHVGRQENCKFHDPSCKGEVILGVKSVKLMHFLKNLLLDSEAWFKPTKYIMMVTKEWSIRIENFMTPR